MIKKFGHDDFTVKAIDTSGEFGALVFDLNENIQKHYKFTETFDLVTNHGTSEHLFNQAAFFENVHNLAKVGDIVVVLGGRTGRDGIHGATFSTLRSISDHRSKNAKYPHKHATLPEPD